MVVRARRVEQRTNEWCALPVGGGAWPAAVVANTPIRSDPIRTMALRRVRCCAVAIACALLAASLLRPRRVATPLTSSTSSKKLPAQEPLQALSNSPSPSASPLPSAAPLPPMPSAPLPLAQSPPAEEPHWTVELARRRGNEFAGSPSLDERERVLAGCRGQTKCGFLSPSGYDALAAEASTLSRGCDLVVLTAVFGRKDKLQQPASEAVPPRLRGCFFAIVDEESAVFLAATAPKSLVRSGDVSNKRVGAWRLLRLRLATSPYASPRRTSRVPKLLPFHLFPNASHSVWIDGKLKLLVEPTALVQRFLTKPDASLALPRNLRRNHIDEEMRWIRSVLAERQGTAARGANVRGGETKAKISAKDEAAVEAQWAFYKREQHQRQQLHQQRHQRRALVNVSGRGSNDRPEDVDAESDGGDGGWMRETACAEGAMILANLKSGFARCVLCAWFNEWHRFGERDQLSLSYVLHAMGLTPPGLEAAAAAGSEDGEPERQRGESSSRSRSAPPHRGVYLWPRREHWHYKRTKRKGEAKPSPYVKYVGHGGCADSPSEVQSPGCAHAKSEG